MKKQSRYVGGRNPYEEDEDKTTPSIIMTVRPKIGFGMKKIRGFNRVVLTTVGVIAETGHYSIKNIKTDVTYTITHLEGEEPKIEENYECK